MMKKVENLYEENNLEGFLKQIENPQEFILGFNTFLKEISITSLDNDNDNNIYSSEKTFDIIVAIMDVFGGKFSNEVVDLIKSLRAPALHRLTRRTNLFKFLLELMNKVSRVDEEFYKVLVDSYKQQFTEMFVNKEKEVNYIGLGGGIYNNKFINEFNSNWSFKRGKIFLNVNLRINPVNYSLNHSKGRMFLTKKVKEIVKTAYPFMKVKSEKIAGKDVGIPYYRINITTKVLLTDDYESVKKEFIEVVEDLTSLENHIKLSLTLSKD